LKSWYFLYSVWKQPFPLIVKKRAY